MRPLTLHITRQPELWVFACLLILCNTHLVSGSAPAEFAAWPDAVNFGYLARVLVHPFVHVSWYHLALDAGAFFILYTGLLQKRTSVRLIYLGACAAGSLALSLALSPVVRAQGLCGLSGVAHGLMAIASLEMIAARQRLLGTACLALVIAKSVFEVLGGQVLFTSLHFGQIGNAIPATHLGGVLGALAAFAIVTAFSRQACPGLNHAHAEA